ncbi:MAG: hypothetical protein ACRD8O_13475 [Bryobacteraceae bacterium]
MTWLIRVTESAAKPTGAGTFITSLLIGEIGRYIYRAHIAGGFYTNFADASARLNIAGDLVYRYGRRIGDENSRGLERRPR